MAATITTQARNCEKSIQRRSIQVIKLSYQVGLQCVQWIVDLMHVQIYGLVMLLHILFGPNGKGVLKSMSTVKVII